MKQTIVFTICLINNMKIAIITIRTKVKIISKITLELLIIFSETNYIILDYTDLLAIMTYHQYSH